jgi:hypothetical protein
MKKLGLLLILLTIGLLVSGCSKSESVQEDDLPPIPSAPPALSDSPDAYVDEQIVDENQEVEIGEMI